MIINLPCNVSFKLSKLKFSASIGSNYITIPVPTRVTDYIFLREVAGSRALTPINSKPIELLKLFERVELKARRSCQLYITRVKLCVAQGMQLVRPYKKHIHTNI